MNAARPPGPTLEQLTELAAQMTSAEWQRLITSSAFIDAACDSLEQSAAVASQLLGREISPRPCATDNDTL